MSKVKVIRPRSNELKTKRESSSCARFHLLLKKKKNNIRFQKHRNVFRFSYPEGSMPQLTGTKIRSIRLISFRYENFNAWGWNFPTPQTQLSKILWNAGQRTCTHNQITSYVQCYRETDNNVWALLIQIKFIE